MDQIRILVDRLADADVINSQIGNAREIMSRLDPECFHVSTFVLGNLDSRLLQRPATRLIQLPQPKVLLEASACALPILARKDYKPETVIDGKSGFLAAIDDELLDRLGELIAKPPLRCVMGRAARTHSEQFDWTLITRRWEEIFRTLVAERGSASAQ